MNQSSIRALFRATPFNAVAKKYLGPLVLAFAVLLQGCNGDCKEIGCLNGGICEDGDCHCPDGFTGPRCGINVQELIDETLGDTAFHFNGQGLGYIVDKVSTIPLYVEPLLGAVFLPTQVDLSDCVPPVRHQGKDGTCTAWATAYYAMTTMYCIDHRISTSERNLEAYQFSPLYAFQATQDRPGSCTGAGFEAVAQTLHLKGCASLQTVPFVQADCDGTPSAAADDEARTHRISSYRRVAFDEYSIKRALASDHVVVFGASVDDSFVSYSGGVVSEQMGAGTFGHSMTLVGYDDARNAFKLVNSWGTEWGENGYGWVDYDFFFDSFCHFEHTFVLNNDDVHFYPPAELNASGPNLTPWIFYDHSTHNTANNRERELRYDLMNYGDQDLEAIHDYELVYMYINSHNPFDAGILMKDHISSSYPQFSDSCQGNDCYYNFDVPINQSLGEQIIFDKGLDKTYEMPSITGSYFLVLFADPFQNVPDESNRSNDLFFVSDHHPIQFNAGYSNKQSQPFSYTNPDPLPQGRRARRDQDLARGKQDLNGYNTAEIRMALRSARASGLWDQWEAAYEVRETRRQSRSTQ